MEEVTNTKVIRFLGHRVHCRSKIKKNYGPIPIIFCLLGQKTSRMTLKYLKSLQCLQKYTALHILNNPDHSLPGLMIKSDASETKHINYRK